MSSTAAVTATLARPRPLTAGERAFARWLVRVALERRRAEARKAAA